MDLGASYAPRVGRVQIGVRPEFVTPDRRDEGLPVMVRGIQDVGRHRIVLADLDGMSLNAVVTEGAEIPADACRVRFAPEQIGVFVDDWRIAPQDRGAQG
jgi:glycerol transport system ATP-binding protein